MISLRRAPGLGSRRQDDLTHKTTGQEASARWTRRAGWIVVFRFFPCGGFSRATATSTTDRGEQLRGRRIFPTATRPATRPQSGTSCECDICQPPTAHETSRIMTRSNWSVSPSLSFAQVNPRQHTRLPFSDSHRCRYCLLRFIRRLDLTEQYESGICRFRFNHPITRKRGLPNTCGKFEHG